MSWEPLKLLNRSGHPLTGSQREIILKGVEKALASPYVNPSIELGKSRTKLAGVE